MIVTRHLPVLSPTRFTPTTLQNLAEIGNTRMTVFTDPSSFTLADSATSCMDFFCIVGNERMIGNEVPTILVEVVVLDVKPIGFIFVKIGFDVVISTVRVAGTSTV